MGSLGLTCDQVKINFLVGPIKCIMHSNEFGDFVVIYFFDRFSNLC
jgi:hypothetical protein